MRFRRRKTLRGTRDGRGIYQREADEFHAMSIARDGTRDRSRGLLLAAIALLCAALAYKYRAMYGFPDGFLTERDRAEKVVLTVFIGVSLLFGCRALFLAQIAHQRPVASALRSSLVIYFCINVLLMAATVYARKTLAGGGGG
jgi:hypothetical protein